MPDFIAWSYTKNGMFSVRSAYSIEWENQYGNKLKYSNGMGRTTVNPIWSKIWKLACPAKVIKFIWHTLHGTLLSRLTLANELTKVSPICSTCSEGLEDTKNMRSSGAVKPRRFGKGWGWMTLLIKLARFTVLERRCSTNP